MHVLTPAPGPGEAASRPRSLVVVLNADSGHHRGQWERARQAMEVEGLQLLETLDLGDLDRLRGWIARPAGERPLVVAAGGDGTVGAVASHLVGTDCVLGILPFGTSNDIARSFGIPMEVEDAVRQFRTGVVHAADVGSFSGTGEPTRYFLHAAAMGISVEFSRMATRKSLRRRLGQLTYVVAGLIALRKRRPFRCELELEGRRLSLCLLHLSVINAPVFGGKLDLRLERSSAEDRRLDVLALEDGPLLRLLVGLVPVALGRSPRVGGVRLYHVRTLHVHVEQPLEVSLDGEIAGHVPSDFAILPGALRVIGAPS